MNPITSRLFSLADASYADFQAKLTPTIPRDAFIGVRVPALRALAKELYKAGGYEDFLLALPHRYYDENMLHGLLIAEMRDYTICIDALERFLPYIDNWAVCDILSPRVFKKHRDTLTEKIREWSASPLTYTRRFGMEMLMTHFLDDDFRPEYLGIPAAVKSEEYYVNMMIAWFFATALAKQWDATVPYLEKHVLPTFVHRKTIQKACESFRITQEQKTYLKSLK